MDAVTRGKPITQEMRNVAKSRGAENHRRSDPCQAGAFSTGGSSCFSLKDILHPLVPHLTYDDLVIVDGMVASVKIARLLFVAGKIPPEQRDKTRQDLLDYCERDTEAMVELLKSLRKLAGIS